MNLINSISGDLEAAASYVRAEMQRARHARPDEEWAETVKPRVWNWLCLQVVREGAGRDALFAGQAGAYTQGLDYRCGFLYSSCWRPCWTRKSLGGLFMLCLGRSTGCFLVWRVNRITRSTSEEWRIHNPPSPPLPLLPARTYCQTPP